jgi:predicted nucleotidyltransferase component of viral defense system
MDLSELKKKIEKEVEFEKVDFIEATDTNFPIGSLEMNATQRLLFSIQEYRGKKYFDMRTWYQADAGEWKPTKKGVHLSFDKFEDFEKLFLLFNKIIPLDE